MKKFLIVFLTVIFLLSLVACGDTVDEDEENVIDEIVSISSAFSIEVGTTSSVDVSVIPESARDSDLRFKSSDESILTVDKKTGSITAIAEGTAVITAYSKENKKISAECTVTVTAHQHSLSEPVEENRVEPTCDKAGSYDSVIYCAYENCRQEVSREKKVIRKAYHNYANSECTNCGQVASEGLEYKIDGNLCVVTGLGSCTDTHIVIPDRYEGVEVTHVDQILFSAFHVKSLTFPATMQWFDARGFWNGSIENFYVEESNENWFSVDGVLFYSYNDVIKLAAYPVGRTDTTYEIPDFVTAIGENAFYKSNLKSITVPDSVESIEKYAFSTSYFLNSVIIGDSVTYIAENAFVDCQTLSSVTLGKKVNQIGDDAFAGCYNLYEIINRSPMNIVMGSSDNGKIGYNAKTVHRGSTKIDQYGDFLFYSDGDEHYLVGFTGKGPFVVLPDSYNGYSYSVVAGSFSRRNDIVSLTIGSGVKDIDSNAFSTCERIIEIINRSALNITPEYSDVGGIRSIEVHSGETRVDIYNGLLFYRYNGINYLVGHDGTQTNLVLPDYYNNSTYKIHANAFLTDTTIESVVIGAGAIEIGYTAFSHCYSLKELTVKNGVRAIKSNAFELCSLSTVIIPDSVEEIGYGAFSDNGILCEVALGAGIIDIKSTAFSNCRTLTLLTVTSLNYYYKSVNNVLYTKDGKTLLTYPAGKTDESFTVPFGVEIIADEAFTANNYLKTVIISDSVKKIGNYAFMDSKNIEVLTIGANVEHIKVWAFTNVNLKNIFWKSTSTVVDEGAFLWASSLENIYFVGSEYEWESLDIDSNGNEHLLGATLHYNVNNFHQ